MCGTMECKNELNLHKLCAKKACIECLETCSQISNKICAQHIDALKLNADTIAANHLCSQDGTINRLCVNELTVGNLNHCLKWRATATSSANFLYNLSSPINWNLIVDDPNGNVAVGPFSYTVPVSGYYVTTFHLNTDSLAGASPIIGTPVGRQRLYVNGVPLRDQAAPFLSFSDEQNSNFNSLVLLNAGDVVTMDYSVLVLDPVAGAMNYVGTVNIEANGSVLDTSIFSIHYLSSLNCTPVVCQPCAPVIIPCADKNPCPVSNPDGSLCWQHECSLR